MGKVYLKPSIATASTSPGYSLQGTSGTVTPADPEDDQTLDCNPSGLWADQKYDVL